MQNGDADEGSLMQRLARLALAHVERRTQVSDSLSPGSWRHHFFASRCFSAALSSMASANSFFSRAFSLSSILQTLGFALVDMADLVRGRQAKGERSRNIRACLRATIQARRAPALCFGGL